MEIQILGIIFLLDIMTRLNQNRDFLYFSRKIKKITNIELKKEQVISVISESLVSMIHTALYLCYDKSVDIVPIKTNFF